ncbi:diacylglycerol/lipid kinase family protein [Actinoplanes teichomyceticus]|uniref:Diacylglycerol kinase (ATP) n=1 Tax=Actinoplanes teichomyceticus TaxID=1867 RepID=A0A561WLQ7_ACTTI|nr:diacylglycerol kinase family protein [Actinoplanes teichomyceticus]TWG24799.1 diacylglycerol kinase (ATP) [Actinoplanes teichomyceticus]GIF15668.1 diacylglycerol kinase [Actinoplanes teichomyceticus]
MPAAADRFTSVVIIANPRAGTTSPAVVADIARRCARRIPDVRSFWTAGRGDGVRLARAVAAADGASVLVIAAGGDGTVREVVEGLVQGTPPGAAPPVLAVVPVGTGNSNYLAQWGEVPWTDALEALLEPAADGPVRAEIRWLDLYRLAETSELILLGACSGLVAEALGVAAGIELTGRARYREALTRAAARHRPYAGRVEVDGDVVHEGPTILANVGGGRYRGGIARLLPFSVLDDGYLDVCVIDATVPAEQVPELITDGGHIGRPGVVYARGKRVTISSTDHTPVPFEHDGELVRGDHRRFTVEVLAAALPVACHAGRPVG